MELALHASQAVLLLSYAARDILWLRLLTLAGLAGLIALDRWIGGPTTSALWWNVAFAAVNAVHAAWLIWERRPVSLSQDELALRHLVFGGLSDRQFARLIAGAEWVQARGGAELIGPHKPVDRVFLLARGRCRVIRQGVRLHVLGPGDFAGELGFLTGRAPDAGVYATEETLALTWPVDTLDDLLESDDNLSAVFRGRLGEDVALKLRAS